MASATTPVTLHSLLSRSSSPDDCWFLAP